MIRCTAPLTKLCSHRRQTVDAYSSLGKLCSHRHQTVDALVNVFHRLAAGGYKCFNYLQVITEQCSLNSRKVSTVFVDSDAGHIRQWSQFVFVTEFDNDLFELTKVIERIRPDGHGQKVLSGAFGGNRGSKTGVDWYPTRANLLLAWAEC